MAVQHTDGPPVDGNVDSLHRIARIFEPYALRCHYRIFRKHGLPALLVRVDPAGKVDLVVRIARRRHPDYRGHVGFGVAGAGRELLQADDVAIGRKHEIDIVAHADAGQPAAGIEHPDVVGKQRNRLTNLIPRLGDRTDLHRLHQLARRAHEGRDGDEQHPEMAAADYQEYQRKVDEPQIDKRKLNERQCANRLGTDAADECRSQKRERSQNSRQQYDGPDQRLHRFLLASNNFFFSSLVRLAYPLDLTLSRIRSTSRVRIALS